MTDRWLTLATAAEHVGYSPDTIGDALRSGELRGYQRKPGGKWRIAVEDLDAWVRGENPPDVQIRSVTRTSMSR